MVYIYRAHIFLTKITAVQSDVALTYHVHRVRWLYSLVVIFCGDGSKPPRPYTIMLKNEEVCGNTIYSSSEASGVNHIIHRSRRLR